MKTMDVMSGTSRDGCAAAIRAAVQAMEASIEMEVHAEVEIDKDAGVIAVRIRRDVRALIATGLVDDYFGVAL